MAKFEKGNPGRPRGAKNKLTEAFWKDFAEAWEASGASALKAVAADDPSTFVRVAASVMPKEAELTVRRIAASQIGDDELANIALGGGDGAAETPGDPPITH